jgi:hypothetical protein
MPSSSIVQPVDSTSLLWPKWNERRQLWQKFLPLPSECWLLHPQHRYLWVILILSIFIAVIVREIVVVFVPLQMDRLCLKCRRTGQDLTDLFLFSPNIHGLGPFPRSSSRHPWHFHIYFSLPGS